MYRKVIASIIGVFMCFTAFRYVQNYDIFRLAGDANLVTCYATFVEKLQDEWWVNATCEQWEDSSSPILSQLFLYLTDQSDVSPVPDINAGRSLNTLALIISFASFPLFVLDIAFSVDAKRLKELRKHVRPNR